jgi:hypothetical protein
MSDLKIDRRTAMLWAASVAAAFSGGIGAFAMTAQTSAPIDPAKGYGLDPNINEGITPWPNTLDADQLTSVARLSDYVLPTEGTAPSASQIGVHAMIDEWVSAPYPEQRADRDLVLKGLNWMNAAAVKAGAAQFSAAPPSVQETILTQLSGSAETVDAPAGFYRKVRKLVIGGYYTTAEGFKDIGYIGNVPLAAFPEPSAEVQAALDRAFETLGLKA